MQRLSAEEIKRLINTSERASLDFKRDQYAIGKGGDFERAKLIKDVLAFANTKLDHDAVILIGVEEEAGGRGRIVGVSEHLRDADVQQIVNSKTNRAIRFCYESVNVDGTEVGVIQIDRFQQRPLYLRCDYGNGKDVFLRGNTVYARQGSSTVQVTPDEIAQMNRLPLGRSRAEADGHPDLKQMAERWLSVFDNHAIKRTQIPLILQRTDLTASMFQSWRSTLEILTEDLIEDACRIFNVRRGWLEGDSDVPYDPAHFNRRMDDIIDSMKRMRLRGSDAALLGLRSGAKELAVEPRQTVGIVLRADVVDLNNQIKCCYQPLYPEWDWSNRAHRWYLKKAFLAASYLDMFFFGYDLAAAQIHELVNGAAFPDPILSKPQPLTWHPDDYVYSPTESMVAKESDDLAEFLAHCEETGFLKKLLDARDQIPELRNKPLDPFAAEPESE